MVVTNMGIELRLPVDVAEEYSSPAQRIRVMTEEWVSRSGFCPSCGRVGGAMHASPLQE